MYERGNGERDREIEIEIEREREKERESESSQRASYHAKYAKLCANPLTKQYVIIIAFNNRIDYLVVLNTQISSREKKLSSLSLTTIVIKHLKNLRPTIRLFAAHLRPGQSFVIGREIRHTLQLYKFTFGYACLLTRYRQTTHV